MKCHGGFVLPGYQPDAHELVQRHGVDRTRALFAASLEAIEMLEVGGVLDEAAKDGGGHKPATDDVRAGIDGTEIDRE